MCHRCQIFHLKVYKTVTMLEYQSDNQGQINSLNLNKQQSIPDNPGVHSDVVSLGSRVWPALSPAHSSASEPAAPTLARDTNIVVGLISHSVILQELTSCYTVQHI